MTNTFKTLTDKLHDAYTSDPGTTPADGTYQGQYEEYDQTYTLGTSTSDAEALLSPRAIGLNNSRVDLGFHNFKRNTWAHRLSDSPTRQEMEQLYNIIVSSA